MSDSGCGSSALFASLRFVGRSPRRSSAIGGWRFPPAITSQLSTCPLPPPVLHSASDEGGSTINLPKASPPPYRAVSSRRLAAPHSDRGGSRTKAGGGRKGQGGESV